ncbi:MAG: lipid-A-disaccharide synthase N-terminal domain-containing protein [Alphaproteobacteria bacterium]|nr:lipid-A-disaccharide synthase N-terminal domain-containing protein [Alphaproteobacteria bacterium]
MHALAAWLESHVTLWTAIGLFGQTMFMMRFVIQWIASERVKQSIVPEVFWYFSLAGGCILLTYAIHQQDLVFILGQGLGLVIYLRNIYFIRKRAPSANA